MRQSRINLKPYQYPVVILGPRQYKHTNVSTYSNSNTIAQTGFNSSATDDTIAGWNYDAAPHSRTKRDDDLHGVMSSGYGGHSYCPEGIPVETALFALLGASALAFGILFMAVTLKTGGRKRKKRNAYDYDSYIQNETSIPFSRVLKDFIFQGSFIFQTVGYRSCT